MPRLFISHSSKDSIQALAFHRWLEANGWSEEDVFIDLRNMGASENWRDTLVKANVSWDQAKAYAAWLSRMTGGEYRLLSEAEWEYAARGVTSTDAPHPAFPWGDKASHEYANYGKDQCCEGITEGRDQWRTTAPVGQFAANAFGLQDMHGNVWEWVEDPWHDNYSGEPPTDGTPWYRDGEKGRRVIRSGSWGFPPVNLRSAGRTGGTAGGRNKYLGIRVGRSLSTSNALSPDQTCATCEE